MNGAMKSIVLAATLMLALALPARADIYDALAAYEAADFEAARKALLPVAKKGDARAQHLLARMYLRGAGVPRNHSQAYQWLIKAAKKGDARAQTALAALFEAGHGVPQEFSDAAKWYRRAAKQGHHKAQAALGRLYINGLGLKRDYVSGHAWLSAAEKGLSGPDLAEVQANIKLAVSEMTLGDLGRGEALAVEIMARTRPGAGQAKPDGDDGKTARDESTSLAAALLLPKYAMFNRRAEVAYESSLLAAEKGEADAQYTQGLILELGAGRPGDAVAALRWYGRAAKQGHAKAAFAAARLCLHGALECQQKRTLGAVRRAAKLGHPWAQALIGESLMLGRRGAGQDVITGYLWLSRALAQDPRFAAQRAKLAGKHMKTKEVVAAEALLLVQLSEPEQQAAKAGAALAKKKYKTALKHFKAAAEAGHLPAQHQLSRLYAKGRGAKRNAKQAAEWTSKAAQAGHTLAQFEMGKTLRQARSKYSGEKKEKAAAKKKRLRELGDQHAAGRQWLLKAAEAGLRPAQAELADMLLEGEGFAADPVLAYMWLAIEGRGGLGRGTQVKALAAKMRPQQIALAEKLAGDWLPLPPGSPLETRVKAAAAEASRIPEQYQALAQRGELAFRASLPLAEEGNAQAQFTLGQIYQRGAGRKRDLKGALHWYRQAAGQGHVDATFAAISLCLSADIRCPAKDRAAWTRSAAEKGHGEAQVLLGQQLMQGSKGVKKDVVEGYVWLTKAAATISGYADFRVKLAERHMSDSEIEAAEKLLAERLGDAERAAAAGAFAYQAQDYGAALGQYAKAAEAGHLEAQYMLGSMLLGGQGGARNVALASEWLNKAAEGDHALAQVMLGNLLDRGRGAAPDPVAARNWYREAAEADQGGGQANLAGMLARGRGGPKDPVLAFMWYLIEDRSQRTTLSGERKSKLAESMTPKQIMVAETLAKGWIPVRLHWR
jgi:hypothetical protein